MLKRHARHRFIIRHDTDRTPIYPIAYGAEVLNQLVGRHQGPKKDKRHEHEAKHAESDKIMGEKEMNGNENDKTYSQEAAITATNCCAKKGDIFSGDNEHLY